MTAAGSIGKPGPLPSRGQGKYNWAAVADLAKNSPGLWVPVKMGSSNQASEQAARIRRHDRGCPVALRDERFTAEARMGACYVSWTG